jgi:prepilin-type N-terminal cleavage/methylation domain-containing protein
MKKNKKLGFTLFELLVSISIIAILTALAIVIQMMKVI